MTANLYNSNGHIRVWAMTPPYREGYVTFEPIANLNGQTSYLMTTDELNKLVHDITAAQLTVMDHNAKKIA